MGTRPTDTATQTVARITKSPKCSLCLKTISEVSHCDWNQGRCPHVPSLLDNILADGYKSRLYNLIKIFKRSK